MLTIKQLSVACGAPRTRGRCSAGFVERAEENVGCFAEDEEFAGVIDVEAGF